MTTRTFNSRYASEEPTDDIDISAYGFDTDAKPVPGLPTLEKPDGDIIFPKGIERILTNNLADLKRNRFEIDPITGEPDPKKPTGKVYYEIFPEIKDDKPVDDPQPLNRFENQPLLKSAPRYNPAEREAQPVHDQRNASIKALDLAMRLVPTQTDHAHDACNATGLVFSDGRPIPCSECEGRGNVLFDTTITGHHADLQSAIGQRNIDLQNHILFCDGPYCFDGCPIAEEVEPVRRALSDAGHTIHGYHVKPNVGASKNPYHEPLRRQLSYLILDDHYTSIATGLRALSARNNTRGAASTRVMPGDIVSLSHRKWDPGATMLVHSINHDGSLNGFTSEISYEDRMAEQASRAELARKSRRGGEAVVDYDLVHDDAREGFSSARPTGDQAFIAHERDSLADIFGRRLSLTGKHQTVAKRKSTDLRFVSNIHPDLASKIDPIIAPQLQYAGHVFRTDRKFGEILGPDGRPLRTRTGREYAQTTKAASYPATVMTRNAEPFSLNNIHESLRSMTGGGRERLMGLLMSANQVNGVSSSGVNYDLPDFGHPLNLLPQDLYNPKIVVQRETVPEETLRAEAQKHAREKMESLGAVVTVDEPKRAHDIVKDLTDGDAAGFRKMITPRVGRELTEEEFGNALKEFQGSGDIRKAHAAIDKAVQTGPTSIEEVDR